MKLLFINLTPVKYILCLISAMNFKTSSLKFLFVTVKIQMHLGLWIMRIILRFYYIVHVLDKCSMKHEPKKIRTLYWVFVILH